MVQQLLGLAHHGRAVRGIHASTRGGESMQPGHKLEPRGAAGLAEARSTGIVFPSTFFVFVGEIPIRGPIAVTTH